MERGAHPVAGRHHDRPFWSALDTVPHPIWQEDWSGTLPELSRLRESEGSRLPRFLRSHPEVISQILGTARVVGANTAACAILSQTPDPSSLQTLFALTTTSADIGTFWASVLATLAEGIPLYRSETTIRTPGGTDLRALLALSFAETWETGRVLVVSNELTGRRQIDESPAAEQSLADTLLESLPGVFYLCDEDGRFLRWNRELTRVAGYTDEEMLRLRLLNLFAVENRVIVEKHIREVFEKGASSVEASLVSRNGMQTPYLMSGTRVNLYERRCLLGIGFDATRLTRAEEADRLKSAFLATMSHELRTPLNSIIGFTGVLLQGLAGPLNAEQMRQLGMVQTSARHLLSLINDILDLSKIEAGQLVIERRPFSVKRVVARVADSLAPAAEKKGLTLRVDVADDVDIVISDERRVEQILLNLLGNAVKFTDRGEVELRVQNLDHPAPVVRFQVRDTGPGMSPSDLPALFQPFRQGTSGLDRKHEGTGLGLAICRRLTDLLGGELTVASALGAGSMFSFSLPRGEEHTA